MADKKKLVMESSMEILKSNLYYSPRLRVGDRAKITYHMFLLKLYFNNSKMISKLFIFTLFSFVILYFNVLILLYGRYV